jgi:ATP adenylyltransferase
MDIVFAPWRLEYIQADKRSQECIFCKAFADEPSVENLVVYKDERVGVMLNRFPYTNGHLLIVPRPHVDSLSGLDKETRSAAAEVIAFCELLLRRVYKAQGINVGLNMGQAAGAGILDHVHWHILPRWTGDTNFTTVCSNLRVVPEDLEAVFNRLRQEFPPRIE